MAIILVPGSEAASARTLQREFAKAKLTAVRATGSKGTLRLHVSSARRAGVRFISQPGRLSWTTPQGTVTIDTGGYRVRQTVTEGTTIFALTPDTTPPPASAAPASIREIFRKRVTRALEQLYTLDERMLSHAVQEPSDLKVLVMALASDESLAAVGMQEPLAAARLRGLEAKRRLLEAEGGTLSTAEAARLLRVSRQAVDRRRTEGKLLALALGKKGYYYPAWQFDLPGMPSVLAALAGRDPWEQLSFFLNPSEGLGDRTPIEALRAGQLPDVLQAATAYAEQG